MTDSFAIKVRKVGTKAFWFLTPKGGETRLRIHASQWSDQAKAEAALKDVTDNNPGFEFKLVPF